MMMNGGNGGSAQGNGFGGSIHGANGGWLAALSATGLEGEPPLLEGAAFLLLYLYFFFAFANTWK